MEQSNLDRLNRVIAAATEIRQAADHLLATALYLRERASDIGDDDRAMIRRSVDRLDENVRYLR